MPPQIAFKTEPKIFFSGACELTEWRCFNFCDYDSLEIHDVISRSGRKLCGKRLPNSPLISTGNAVNIKFSTDVSTGGKGFKIAYAIVHGEWSNTNGAFDMIFCCVIEYNIHNQQLYSM